METDVGDLLIRNLENELRRDLESLARRERRSLSDVAKQLLRRGVVGYSSVGGQPARGLGSRLAQLGAGLGDIPGLIAGRDDIGREPPFGQ
jgi:antitoxin FitA